MRGYFDGIEMYIDIPHRINISRGEAKNITLKTLHWIFDIDEEWYLTEDKYIEKWYRTHGSGDTERIRKATKRDLLFFSIKKEIENHKAE